VESLSAWCGRELFGDTGGGESGGGVSEGGGAAERSGMPVVVTVIGSGGKTSLIWCLARYFAGSPGVSGGQSGVRPRSILVTTTTKMFPPTEAIPGVTVCGRLNEVSGKLEALAPGELEQRAAASDLVLIEGDGSRTLPLKGWADHEPVVPSLTTVTVGVLPLWPLGKPVSAEIVHRIERFCALSGASPGETLKTEHLARVIAGGGREKSLFSDARGGKILLLNQIEDEASLDCARELVSLLPPGFRSGLSGIIAGSVRLDRAVAFTFAPSIFMEFPFDSPKI
jgi:probable selenium-dependent hydroxylase accessory protein YqeC